MTYVHESHLGSAVHIAWQIFGSVFGGRWLEITSNHKHSVRKLTSRSHNQLWIAGVYLPAIVVAPTCPENNL